MDESVSHYPMIRASWMRVLAAVLLVLLCFSVIEDFATLQSVYGGSKNNAGQDRKNGTLNWAHLLQDSMRNKSSLRNSWLPFNSSFADLSDWRVDTDVKGNEINPSSPIPIDMSSSDDETGQPVFGSSFTIVIQLSGEMANQLCKLAFGYGLKWMLEDDHNITSNIILRHQENPKWVTAHKSMRLCYPKIRTMDFSQGNTREFDDRQKQQDRWLGHNDFHHLTSASRASESLNKFVRLISNTRQLPPELPVDANITLPFIYADSHDSPSIVDRFFDRLKDLFEYDLENPKCCGPRALLNENAFHARGFLVEMPRVGKRLGFEELSPNKTVAELLKNHPRGGKIAVLGRFPAFGQQYVDQMLSAGLDARLVETDSGEQSFCFLMSVQGEIIGSSQSTFIKWASYLGNASEARIYSLRSPERLALGKHHHQQWNFTHPKLMRKFSFESYNSEEQDLIDRSGLRRERLQK